MQAMITPASCATKKLLLPKQMLFFFCTLLSFTAIRAQTNTYSAVTGNWSVVANWSQGHVPAAGEDVVIPASAIVTLDATPVSINSLSVSGTLTYGITTARSITVAGDVTINAGGILQSGASTTIVNTLSIGGNFSNGGTFNALASANNKITVAFTGAANNSFTNAGAVSTVFSLITLNKGTANTNVLDFNPTSTVSFPATGALTITNGTFELDGAVAISNPIFAAAAYAIPATGGFWLNNPNATVTGLAGNATVAGLLRVSSGVYNIGSAVNNSMGWSTGASIMIEGGAVNAQGKFGVAAAANAITYNQSGGTVTVGTGGGSNSATIASFDAGTSTSTSFTLSAGTIVLAKSAGTNTEYRGPASGATLAITAGTLQAGNAGTAAAAVFKMSAVAPNIVLDNSSAQNPGITLTAGLIVRGDIALNGSGTFNKGAFALTMQGLSAINPGNIIVNGTNTLTLNGATTAATALSFSSIYGNQALAPGSGSITNNELCSIAVVNPSGTVTIPSGLTMISATTLTLTAGILNAGSSIQFGNATASTFTCIRTAGSLLAASSAFGAGVTTKTYTYNGAGAITTGPELTTTSPVTINTLTVNNSTLSLTLDKEVKLATSLVLTNGIINTTNTNLLTLGTAGAGTLTGGSSANYINGPFARSFAASRTTTGTYTQATLYPFGLNSRYIPLYVDPNTDATGAVTIKLETVSDVVGAPAWVTPLVYTSFKKLSREWQVTLSGPGVITGYNIGFAQGAGSLPSNETFSSYFLITNPDGTGSFTDGKAAPLNNNTSTTGIQNTYPATGLSTVTDLPSGSHFTVGTMAGSAIGPASTTIPGGQGFGYGLQFWLKADAGITATGGQVTQWTNQIANYLVPMTTQASTTASPNVTLIDNGINYNPTVNFQGGSLTGQIANISPNPAFTFAVAKGHGDACCGSILSFGPNGQNGAIIANAAGQYGLDNNGNTFYPTDVPFTADSTNIISARYTAVGSTTGKISCNGLQSVLATNVAGNTYTASPYPANGNFTLGNRYDSHAFTGQVAEIINFVDVSNPVSRKQVEGYLAMKYGITLDISTGASAGKLILSDISTTIWDPTTNPAYQHNVVGVVRDNGAGLLQKQSHTADDSVRIFVSTLAATNAANTGGPAMNNKSAIIIGDNGGLLKDDASAAKPAGIYHMFGRSWMITKTNFPTPFSLEIKWDSAGSFDINDIRLLVSASPDFSSATVLSTASGITITRGSIIIGNITTQIPNGATSFITIGSATTTTTLNAAVMLPITLVDFAATATADAKVNLNWQTAAEINSDHFVVEKSSDGGNWQTLVNVKAAGNSSAPLLYSAVDKNPYSGLSYYRLKQTDLDGKFSYSDVKTVRVDNIRAGVTVYPNPVENRLTIKGEAAELKTVKIYSLGGQDLTAVVKKVSNNNTMLVLDVSMLPAGMYTVKTANSMTKILKP